MDRERDGYGEQISHLVTRPMKVKVLYCFDADSKTNCLARLPNTFQIPSVTVNNGTSVGVVALQKCLQAITLSSPELLSASTTTDYIIYAFDYSEDGNPLVGQGMLSDILTRVNMENSTGDAVITGRICKNNSAIFNNGVTETLEVKLKLVPMAVSTKTPLNGNIGLGALEQMQPLDYAFGMCEGEDAHASRTSFNLEQDSMNLSQYLPAAPLERAMTAPGSRSGSPAVVSACGSPASIHSVPTFTRSAVHAQRQSQPDPRHMSFDETTIAVNRDFLTQWGNSRNREAGAQDAFYNEDNQPRKRAKVIQADWRGRSSFGPKSSDLRVTASTAASMQMHRPIPKRNPVDSSNLDPPPRVPTPIPTRSIHLQQQDKNQGSERRSLLRQASVADSDAVSEYDSHYSDVIASSPEDQSPENSITAEGTPYDIPSSPPVFSAAYQALPSSPHLPSLPLTRMNDSGYMSEQGVSSSHESNHADLEQNPSVHSSHKTFFKKESDQGGISASLRETTASTMNVRFESPGDMNQLPQKLLLDIPPSRQRQIDQKLKQSMAGDTHNVGQTVDPQPVRKNSLVLPALNGQPAISDTEPSSRLPQKLVRSITADSGRMAQASESCSPAPSDSEYGRPSGPKRSGSGAARRKVIKERMERSIAEGSMPHFCHHCGAIETPTWRKLYVKFVDGKPSPLDYSEGEGETIGVENLEMNEDGEVTRFIIRKSMKRTKDFKPGPGFKDISVCNPCGLWFGKFRSMRPADKWHKRSTTRKGKKRLEDEDDSVPPDEAELFLEPSFENTANTEDFGMVRNFAEPEVFSAELSAGSRACSVQLDDNTFNKPTRAAKASALSRVAGREIQSSPVRFHGSKTSPIELDENSPRPTRRLLFPSPRRNGELKRLDDTTISPTGKKFSQTTQKISTLPDTDPQVFDVFVCQKENLDPNFAEMNVDTGKKAQGFLDSCFQTPSKSSSKETGAINVQLQTDVLLKTPTPGSRKRKIVTPRSADCNPSNESTSIALVRDFLTSPSSPRYFLRSTPSRQERTPIQKLSHSQMNPTDVSPFSKHLAQMLSDGTEPALFTSPARNWDFNHDFPTYSTPGRNVDWAGIDDLLSSEYPTIDESMLQQ